MEAAKQLLNNRDAGAAWWSALEWTDALWLLAAPFLYALWRLFKKGLEAVEAEAEKRLVEQVPRAMDKAMVALVRCFTPGFASRYRRRLIHIYRTYRTLGLKTRGPFTLDLDQVFVPLQVAPESPHRISAHMVRAGIGEGVSIWDYLTHAGQLAYRCIAVIGPPGSGKSTLLEHLTLTFAQNTQRRHHPKAPKLLPVLLYLRLHRERIGAESPPDLPALLEEQKELRDLDPPAGWFKRRLRRGGCLVMLDGLDEVADAAQRQAVGRWVNRQMQDYPDVRFILTSRPFGYHDAPLDQVGTVLAVRPFSLAQMARFLDHWYLQNEAMRQRRRVDEGVRIEAVRKATDLKRRIRDHPALRDMAVNPLLLTMIATAHDNRGALPGRRVELYAEICDVLLGRRQEAKGMTEPLSAALKKQVLQTLALELMLRATREFDLATGGAIIAEALAAVAGKDADPARFLTQVEELSGLLVEREAGVYEFVHKSFQEYLAAAEILGAHREGLLTHHLDDPAWAEVVRLYAAQAGKADGLFRTILDYPTVGGLSLAYDCLEEGVSVAPELRQAILDRVEAGLESADPERAALAASVKLSQRLKHLTPLDDDRLIDPAYLTCAEYQLFIDERRRQGDNCQPDHWTSHHFPADSAAAPITGVRAADAAEFCQWLSDRHAEAGFRYRLPSLEEAGTVEPAVQGLGCWCREGDGLRVDNVPPQWREWISRLLNNFTGDLDCALDLNPEETHRLYPIIDFARIIGLDPFDIGLVFSRAGDRDLAIAIDLARASDLDRAFNRSLNLDHTLNHDCTIRIDRILSLDRILARASALPNDIYDFTRVLSRVLDNVSERDRALTYDYAHAFNVALAQVLVRNPNEVSIAALLFLRESFSMFVYLLAVGNANEIQLTPLDSLRLYLFCCVIDERLKGNLPAWEGIRLVKERIDELPGQRIRPTPATPPAPPPPPSPSPR